MKVFRVLLFIILFPVPSYAAMHIFTFTGKIKSGHGFHAKDQNGTFFGKPDLEGERFTLTFTFDDSKGETRQFYNKNNVLFATKFIGDERNSPGTAVLTINGRSFTFGVIRSDFNKNIPAFSSGEESFFSNPIKAFAADQLSSVITVNLSNPQGPRKEFLINSAYGPNAKAEETLMINLFYNPTMDNCQLSDDWRISTNCLPNKSSWGRFKIWRPAQNSREFAYDYETTGEFYFDTVPVRVDPVSPRLSKEKFVVKNWDYCPAQPSLPMSSFRMCCAMGALIGSNPVDPNALGNHTYEGGGVVGYVYTTKAGLIDLGHVRDLADLTRYIYNRLHLGGDQEFVLYEGKVNVKLSGVTLTESFLRDLAGEIAYAEGLAHELSTWTKEDFSSFSPEDVPSNIVGIQVAKAALEKGCTDFNQQMTAELKSTLDALGAQSQETTDKILEFLHGKWWERGFTKAGSVLLRHNFDGNIWFPVNPLGESALKWLNAAQFQLSSSYFTYTMVKTVSVEGKGEISDIPSRAFPQVIETIRNDWLKDPSHASMDKWL